MNLLDAGLLGVVEGLTEFLPVSSTAHLTVAEKVLGMKVDDAGVTAFTAIIQVGAIGAVLVYFRRDIVQLVRAWVAGVRSPQARVDPHWQLGWAVIIGSVPIGVVGLVGKDAVGSLRNLWVVAAALVGWSAVMVLAERYATQKRAETGVRWLDGLLVGLAQCVALVPGVSRSGATISAGLLRGLDRVSATRLSFFLSIPAMTAAAAFEAADQASAISRTVGWAPTVLGTVVAALVAYAAIAWLLRLVARHSIAVFVPYRLAAGVLLALVLAAGLLKPT